MLINRARKRQRGVPVFYPLDEERTAPTAPEQTRRIEAMDLQRLYRRTVRAMPPKTRRVFVLHRVYRMTYKQIAQHTGDRKSVVEGKRGSVRVHPSGCRF